MSGKLPAKVSMRENLRVRKRKLGEILVQSGLLSEEQLLKALEKQKKTGKRLGEVLVELKMTTEVEIAQTLGSQLGYQYIEIITSIDKETLLLIPETLVRKHTVIPLRFDRRGVLIVAMADPLDFNTIQDLSFFCGFIIQPAIATPTLLQESIKNFYGHLNTQADEKLITKIINESQKDFSEAPLQIIPEIKNDSSDGLTEQRHQLAPIIEMANLILAKALKLNTSDIHIEPFANESIVRYRVDGFLHESMRFPKWIHGALVSRIKVLANLDIAVKRVPQDGDIRLKANGKDVTLRISSLPSYFGEKVVIRILDETTDLLRLESMGLSPVDQDQVKKMLSNRKGLILVTGPTGSGKTTSLYAMLNQINHPSINIITVENPIEYHIPGITQVQINSESGLTFATALRSILRQDPNVILIGEIRDAETAQIAMRAALTGHLVISTLHTNDAPSAVNRLLDLGIPNFLISTLLIGVIAQRLVRQICSDCKTPHIPSDEEKKAFNLSETTSDNIGFFAGKGCKNCHNSGFKGRNAVYEILLMNSKLREIISLNPTEQQIRTASRDHGFTSMYENGLQKVMAGITTYGEVLRCIGVDDYSDTFCGNCNNLYRAEFNLCPACGEKPKNRCGHCNQMIQLNWNYCPFCEYRLEKSEA